MKSYEGSKPKSSKFNRRKKKYAMRPKRKGLPRSKRKRIVYFEFNKRKTSK
jgi:hypothetical protein